jgi:hypothetical protein
MFTWETRVKLETILGIDFDSMLITDQHGTKGRVKCCGEDPL